jgi:hypothetical protein
MRKPNTAIFKSSQHSADIGQTRSNHKLVNKFVKRSAILGIGVFVLVALSTQTANTHTTKSDNSKQTSIDLVQNKPATQSTTASNSNSESQDSMSNSSQGNSVSTNVTSNTTNGSSSTTITVNGKPVSVPSNGYLNTNVDNTQVNVSHSQTDQGSSVNLNVSSNSDSESGDN